MSKNLKLFTGDTSRQTYEQSQEYLEPYVGGVSSEQTSSYNTRNFGKYFIDYKRSELRLSDFDINKDIIEVEYLESTGTQYINTGYRLWTSSITIETEMAFTDLTVNRGIEGAADAFYYGINNNRYETAYQNYWGTTDTNFHTFKKTLTKSSNNFTTQTWIDGISRYNSTSTYITTAIRSYITLFGTTSSSGVGENFYVGNYLKCRKKSFKLIIDDEVVRDMIPVRIGNTGYMYDKVSRALFGNSGTGDFVIGPDKYDAQIEYLKTLGHGDCYIDIPISNTVNFKKEFVFKAEHTNSKYDIVAQQIGTNTIFLFWSINASGFAVYFGGKETIFNTSANSRNQKVKVIAKQPNITVDINGSITNKNCTIGSITTSDKFRLFSQRTDRVGIISIYYFKAWNENDTLILDLIPVRIGNSGYMYDKLSGRLFGNSGTGEFTLGPDVV